MSGHENDDQNIGAPNIDAAGIDTAGYAVNALSPRERAEIERQAEGSEATRNEVNEMSNTAALLGLAVAPVQPSAQLKASIMAKLASTPQLPREQAAADASPQQVEPVAVPEAAPGAPAARGAATTRQAARATAAPGAVESRARARWFARPAGILAAAAVAAGLFVGGTFVGQSMVHNDFEVAQATALAELQTAADAQQASAEVAGGGEATLIWSLEQRRSVVMINGLDPLPQGETYQLWYIGESGPVSAGTFEAAESGSSWRVLDGAMSAGDTVGVTVEPDGGSQKPTTDPVVAIPSA